MKKLCLLVILATFLFNCADTLAEGGDSYGVENMPEEIKVIVNNSRWSGWEITGWVNPKGLRSNSACAFAAVKNGVENDLLAFGWDDDGWKYKWHNAAALPQVEAPVFLGVLAQNNTVRFTSFYVFNDEIMENFCIWVQAKDGTWRLKEMHKYDPLMFFDTSYHNALRLYNIGWTDRDIDVWVYGSYQTDLRYFNLSVFPTTVEEARKKLSNPPKIPDGTLTATKVQFTSGKKYKVFQGPGEEYGQAGNGKAVVSTNDWIQVFGEENGWIFIQYDISSDRMRTGWITSDALPRNATVSKLAFTPVAAVLDYEANLTDDPLNSQTPIATRAQGTKLIWLAGMGEWAYVEIVEDPPIRGFVKIESLNAETVVR